MAVVQAAAKYTSLHFIPSFHERLPPLTRSNFLLPRNDGVRLYPLPLRSTFPSFDNPKPYRLFKFRFCLPEASSKSRIEKNDLQFEVLENNSEEALLRATANLRVRTFYDFKQSYGVEEHCQYMSGLELEALKERIAGKRLGFKRVACIIATLCTSKTLNVSEDFYSACKAMINDKELLVVGSVDLNQSNQLPDEIPGSRPEGAAADFTRAYLTNVCVANELHRNGIGTELIVQAVKVAYQWGMTDLYVHVAVDNEAARFLYEKSGFAYESDEPAWKARFLGRPRRLLLWASVEKLLSQFTKG